MEFHATYPHELHLSEMPPHLPVEALVLALASFLAVAVVLRFRFSPILGYLAAGLLIGPHGLSLLTATKGIQLLGEVGIAILMFVVGLEFSWRRMIAAKRVVFGFGSLQVGATALLAMPLCLWTGAGLLASFLVSFALALSSTAIVHKELIDRDEATSHHGVLSTGLLLFQDFAALPLLALAGGLHRGTDYAFSGVLRVGLIVGSFMLVALFARPILGRLLAWTAGARSNELFLIATISLLLGSAVAAESLHLSLPVGAFIVGMIVGESDFRHQLEDEIRPFRDLLLGLFFLTIGMSINLQIVLREPGATLLMLIVLLLIKPAVLFAILRTGRVDRAASTRVALYLAHGGEFSLLLMSQTSGTGVIPVSLSQPALAAVALSMFLAPVVSQSGARLAAAMWKQFSGEAERAQEASVRESAATLRDHVILAGCGPIGRLVATALEASKVPYVAIERDLDRLRRAQAQGHHVVFGDATRHGILRAAGFERARAIVVLMHSPGSVERLLRAVRSARPGIPVIVSTRGDTGLEPIVSAGATHIFPENLAAGLALATQTLIVLGIPAREALEKIRTLRAELNPELGALPPSNEAR